MHYTAIIKDGGLFIPNVFSELDDGSSHIVQVEVEVDIEAVREQLDASDAPRKAVAKQLKRPVKKATKKQIHDADLDKLRHSATDELAAFDDSELSEMLKAYMNDEQVSAQISLENL